MIRNSNWRYFPTRFKSVWVRAFLSGVQFSVVYYGGTLLLLATVCLAGGMGGEGNVCAVRCHIYPWIKGAWALVLAVAAWPNAFLGHLNKSNLPQDVYDLFLGRTRLTHPELFAPKKHFNADGTPISTSGGSAGITVSGPADLGASVFDTALSVAPASYGSSSMYQSTGGSVAGSAQSQHFVPNPNVPTYEVHKPNRSGH